MMINKHLLYIIIIIMSCAA